jgi:hypothetical protein
MIASDLVASFEALPAEEKPKAAEILREGNPGLFPKDDEAKVKLWRYLMTGSFLIAVLSIGAAIYFAYLDLDPSPWLVVVSAISAGIIGLFAKSPVQS